MAHDDDFDGWERIVRLLYIWLWAIGLGTLLPVAAPASPSHLIVWAWERSEDLRFLPPDTEIAVQTGFITLSGAAINARGRRFPLKARPEQVTTAVVHLQIDPLRPLQWTPTLRTATVNEVIRLARAPGVRRLQIDFEVPASKRQVLSDVLSGLRSGLPTHTRLSMTALASWCLRETWLSRAPVDEIAPMLFRMGEDGDVIRARLSGGADFQPFCRQAMAVSADEMIANAPPNRRVYLFDPRPWTAGEFARVRARVETWSVH